MALVTSSTAVSLPRLIRRTSAVEHSETAVIGGNVYVSPEESFHAHEAAFDYSLSKVVVACIQAYDTHTQLAAWTHTHANYWLRKIQSYTIKIVTHTPI